MIFTISLRWFFQAVPCHDNISPEEQKLKYLDEIKEKNQLRAKISYFDFYFLFFIFDFSEEDSERFRATIITISSQLFFSSSSVAQ